MKFLSKIDNMSMLFDFYELTMGNGYFEKGFCDKIVYFDVFYRKVPDGGGYAIACGLEQIIDYMSELRFDDEDIAYLRTFNLFSEEFLTYLRNFKFECDVWAVPEGTVIFPGEPILTVRGPVIQAQLVETMVLLSINHQSLIATKANRIVRAAAGRPVMEFGARRAQGIQGAVMGARAAYIAGCAGTSCTIAGEEFNIPALGTMAHSWIQLFENEYEAFKAYAQVYPSSCSLLVDTYNVLKSGVPNAIKVFNEIVVPAGFRPHSIRLDSGDIAYLTIKARKMLDEAGFSDCKIIVSNSLDEFIIRDAIAQGAKIDSFGVGERLITSKSEPVFGGVYKLCAVEDEKGNIAPRIKVSENIEKITTPHFKKLYRLYNKKEKKAFADVICMHDETIDDTKPYELFDPNFTWKRKVVTDFTARELLVRIFDKGELVYEIPDIQKVREYCLEEVARLWDEVTRFENPHRYYVDLSQKLWDVKNDMLTQIKA
ncbi:MAG: nicotinate phosphoribosyltransferase [Ruminococcaceae bacterium]|nr:nicotinate phosphoribosyltransferase [Oscillospiraceae bacterium]